LRCVPAIFMVAGSRLDRLSHILQEKTLIPGKGGNVPFQVGHSSAS
jgi:hypothetical protein